MKSTGIICSMGPLFAAVFFSVKAGDIELTSVAFYDDQVSCQGLAAPATLVNAWTEDICESDTSCSLSEGQYPLTKCVTTDGSSTGDFYSVYLPSVFNGAPYIAVQKYEDISSCGDASKLDSVSVFLADGGCHSVSTTSFVATKAESGASIVIWYNDTSCNQVTGDSIQATSAQVTNSLSGCFTAEDGAVIKVFGEGMTATDTTEPNSGVGSMGSSSAPSGEYTAFVAFDGSECGEVASATISRQSCANGQCLTSEYGVSFQHSCTEGYLEFASAAFNSTPYLVAQLHIGTKGCATELAQVIYKADDACHVLPSLHSYKAALNSNGSVVLAQYSDMKCLMSKVEILLTQDELSAHSCIGNIKYYASTAEPASTPLTPTPTPTTAATASTGSGTSTASPLPLILAAPLASLGGLAVLLL